VATQVYPSDVNDAEWGLLALLIPPAKSRSRQRSNGSRFRDLRAPVRLLSHLPLTNPEMKRLLILSAGSRLRSS
jgi:hypothetical protein